MATKAKASGAHNLLPGKSRMQKRAKEAAPHTAWNALAKLLEEVEKIPPEAFENTPRDLAMNVDHYLYGHPKVEP